MPNEIVTVNISGVNPQTLTRTVNVSASLGTGTVPISWTGANFGLDSISASATITGSGLTSNTAQTRWGYADIVPVFNSSGASGGPSSTTFWTFVVIGVMPDGTHTGSSHSVTINYTHFYLSWNAVPGVSYYNVYCTSSIQGQAGGLSATVGLLHGVGSGNGGDNSSTRAGGGPNFPPSFTQMWMDDGAMFPYRGDGSAPPATNTTMLAPSLATPSGKLTIIPSGSALVVGGVQTLTVNVSGIVYTSVPYIPLYQGVSGTLPLYNNPSSNVFAYQTYNGSPVDKATAVSSAWSLSGDNTYWQGRTSVAYDGTNFNLSYNGSAPASGVDTTNLTIIADDIAWYNATPKTFDLFAVQGTAGGVTDSILVNWLVEPTVASVSPTTALANGTSQTFTVTLSSPIGPRQLGTQYATGNSISSSFSMVGGTVTTPNGVAIYNGSGWLTGWTVTATIPSSSSNGTATLSASVTGTLTYLNGTSFAIGAGVTYITGAIATITTTGLGFTAPQAYSFSVSPAGPSYTGAIAITPTGVVFQQQNNPITMEFISSTGNIVAGTQTNRATGSFGGNSGWITTFAGPSFTSSSYLPASPGVNLGFRATDSTSGLSVTFLTSGSYYEITGGGGGGGGGCPAVEMFLDGTHRVCDAILGFAVNTLAGEAEDYVNGLPLTEDAEIIHMDYSTQPCYHLIAENSAEIIVSDSTPVPTREAIIIIAQGASIDEIPVYANQVRAGMHVITDVGNGLEWSMLTETVAIGMRRVCRLHCGGRNFAAGRQPGKYIYTHNLLYVK